MINARRLGDCTRLTNSNIYSFTPQNKPYLIWDSMTYGLGLKINPSGYLSYVIDFSVMGKSFSKTIGSAVLYSIEEARFECWKKLYQTLEQLLENKDLENSPKTVTFQHFYEKIWFPECVPLMKSSTQKRVESAMNHQLLPNFGQSQLQIISPLMISVWFDEYSKTSPGGANRVLDVLVQVLNHAVKKEVINKNPTHGIKRNPKKKITRYLSRNEVKKLLKCLKRFENKLPSQRQQADLIKVLLFTGCRKGEIVNLRWDEVKDNKLELTDSKTGPRTVFLNNTAKNLIAVQKTLDLVRTGGSNSPYVFPSLKDPIKPRSIHIPVWYQVRKSIGLEDVRLHDLRHTFASHALKQGIPLSIVSKLLGHNNIEMTLRYSHVNDKDVRYASNRIGRLLEGYINS